jgi:hypothetical protein
VTIPGNLGSNLFWQDSVQAVTTNCLFKMKRVNLQALTLVKPFAGIACNYLHHIVKPHIFAQLTCGTQRPRNRTSPHCTGGFCERSRQTPSVQTWTVVR